MYAWNYNHVENQHNSLRHRMTSNNIQVLILEPANVKRYKQRGIKTANQLTLK